MKTKEFIEILQKADPSGEAHIRMPDGSIPYYAELKPGYYDGPYSYLDENGKWIYTTNGMKVDVYSCEKYSFAWDLVGETNPWVVTEEEAWNHVKKHFDVTTTYFYEKDRLERTEGFFKEVREAFDDAFPFHIRHWNQSLDEVIEKAKNGWKFYQREDSKRINEFIVIDDKGNIQVGTNYATSRPLYDSGKFTRSKNGISGNDLLPKKNFMNWFTKKPYPKEYYDVMYYEWSI